MWEQPRLEIVEAVHQHSHVGTKLFAVIGDVTELVAEVGEHSIFELFGNLVVEIGDGHDAVDFLGYGVELLGDLLEHFSRRFRK